MKKLLCIALALLTALGLTACKKEDPLAGMPNPVATITMTDGRVMRFELHYHTATNTVLNFIELANDGFYDGMTFHRVIPGVLIQSGCPNGDGSGTAGHTIKGEFSANGFENGLSHNRGVLSMARTTSDMNSASSQFFIMQGNYPEYDGQYAAFGTAMDEETLANIDTIAAQPVDGYYAPLREQVISTIRVEIHGYELPEAAVTLIEKKEEE